MQAIPKRAPRWQWAVFLTMALLLPIVVAATWWGSTAGYGPPAILVAADRDEPHVADIDKRLTAALNRRFPQGSDAGAMRTALLGEGFRDDTAGNTLVYRWDETICDHFVYVYWNVDAHNRITGIMGRYRDICL
jgi:hypothetical protein